MDARLREQGKQGLGEYEIVEPTADMLIKPERGLPPGLKERFAWMRKTPGYREHLKGIAGDMVAAQIRPGNPKAAERAARATDKLRALLDSSDRHLGWYWWKGPPRRLYSV